MDMIALFERERALLGKLRELLVQQLLFVCCEKSREDLIAEISAIEVALGFCLARLQSCPFPFVLDQLFDVNDDVIEFIGEIIDGTMTDYTVN